MRIVILIGLLVLYASEGFSQKYSLKAGEIVFFSEAPLEDIRASNKEIASLFVPSSSEIAFSVPVSKFKFEKKLMQQHFNEKYMESDKYPRSTFSGKLIGFDSSRQGTQKVKAVGNLTIHGVTNQVEIPGTVSVGRENILMNSVFQIRLQDYKIKIPQLLWQNIAEKVEVSVSFEYRPQ